jgi:putative DNA primase/helicase
LHKAFLLYGGGRNGKSTFLDIIKEICGHENCTSISFKDLGEKFRVAELYNKLVSLSGDISAQPLKDSDLFKQICGGDEITIERKNAHPFTDTVFATLFFSANKLPRTPDTTYGFYRKLVIIPFNANLNKVSLVDGASFHSKLMEDVEYIAYKAVLAIKNVLDTTHQFIEPDCVKDIMNLYKVENSSILSWVQAKKITTSHMKAVKFDELYAEYNLWCELNGFKTVRSTRFEQEVQEEFNLVVDNDTLIDK